VLLTILFISVLLSKEEKKVTVIYQEDFNGSTLNSDIWSIDVGDGCPELCGWGNNEQQYYLPKNLSVENGQLVITATEENGRITSGKIHTRDKLEVKYGRIEVRAKLPDGDGTWPAIWMLGFDVNELGWPECGEIDIMEYSGGKTGIVHTSLHNSSSYGNTVNTAKTHIPSASTDFHDYRIDWTPESIKFFIDNKQVYNYSPKVKTPENWPYDKPFYLIVNLAMGGTFTGHSVDKESLPQQLIIDHIKISKINL
jgi:beta-glucanase (GH16 family)